MSSFLPEMTFGNRLTTLTQDTILPKVFDNILTDNFMTFRYLSNGEKWSGETLKRPIKISKNSLGGSFSGLDTFSTNTVDTRIMMSYDVRGYEIPIAIPGMEKAVNSGSETQVMNLVSTEIQSTQNDALDDIGSLFYLDGTGNNSKDFNGLDVLDDDGTSSTNVGNQSRTTFTSLKGVRTASGGTVSISKLATLFSGVAGGSSQKKRPTVIVSSEAEFDLYDSLLSPTVRANYDANGLPQITRTSRAPIPAAQMKGQAGYTSLIYRGIPWVADEKAPVGTIWMLNESVLQWYGLSSSDLQQVPLGDSVDGVYTEIPSSNTGLQWTGFMKPINQFGEVGHIILMGNFATWEPRRHGRLTGVTGV